MLDILVKHKKFYIYVLVSILMSILNIAIFIIILYLFNFITNKSSYIICNITTWIITIFITFFANKKFVFHDDNKSIKLKLIKFYGIRVSSLVIDSLILMLCLNLFNFGIIISKIISNISTTFNNYFISKIFIFKEK